MRTGAAFLFQITEVKIGLGYYFLASLAVPWIFGCPTTEDKHVSITKIDVGWRG